MFKNKSSWDQWGIQGYDLVNSYYLLFQDLNQIVLDQKPPKVNSLDLIVKALDELNEKRLAFQSKWGSIAGQDSKCAGSYLLLSGSAFVIEQVLPLLWAGYLFVNSDSKDPEALRAMGLARDLAINAKANANGVMLHLGKMSEVEGLRWTSKHFPIVTTSSQYISSLTRVENDENMPSEWKLPSFN